jgi:spermidine/putrescine transport system substrate-binding protein
MTGDVWLAQVYSGDGMQLMRDNPDFKYVETNEGGILWVDNLTIPQLSKNKEMAHQFIDYILRPEVEEQIVKDLFYSSPNKGLEKVDIPENLKASFIKKLDRKKFEYINDLGIDTQKWDLIWTQIKSK